MAAVAPMVKARSQVIAGNRNWVPLAIVGTTPAFLAVRDWEPLAEGVSFSDRDVRNGSQVCLVPARPDATGRAQAEVRPPDCPARGVGLPAPGQGARVHPVGAVRGDRRAVVRLLIEGVELTRDGASERIDVTSHWRGGAVTRHEVRQGLRAYRALGGLAKLRERILELRGDGRTADAIAEVLNREGYQVARGVGFTGDRVHQLLARFGQTGVPPGVRDAGDLPGADECWLPELAARLGVKPIVVHRWRWSGWLPCPRGTVVWSGRTTVNVTDPVGTSTCRSRQGDDEIKARDLISTMSLGFDPMRQEKARTEHILLLIDEYHEALIATAGERQRSQVKQRLVWIADELHVTTLAGMTAEAVQGWINRLKRSARTKHHYRTSVRSFGAWLEQTGRTPRNPFVGLEKVWGIEADRRLVRRALSAAEFELLVTTTERSLRKFCKLSGKRRAMLYRLVAATGFRRGEVSSLVPSSFRLTDAVPIVVVEAAYTKNRKRAVQPLPLSLVPLLSDYLRGLPERPVWPVGKGMTSLMVQGDLEEAGIPVKVDGRSSDFHSLRGQFCTRLALAGVGLSAAMRLMRHSTPTLTMATYTHLGLKDLGDAVAGL